MDEGTEGSTLVADAEGESIEALKARAERAEKEAASARKEAAKYRVQARQTQIVAEFGDSVAEFVPKDLPLEEAREYAQKLKDTFGSSTTDSSEEAAQEASPVDEASPLAAVSKPSTQGTQTDGRLTMSQIDALAKTDPSAAAQAIRTGNWIPD